MKNGVSLFPDSEKDNSLKNNPFRKKQTKK